MRQAVVVVTLLLLAGCSGPEPKGAEPDPAVEEPLVAGTEDVEEFLRSNLSVCPPVAGGCAGAWGQDAWVAEGHAWTALVVTVEPREGDPLNPAAAPLTQVRIVAECMGERLTCPQGPLAVAEGGPDDFPLRLVAGGFRIVEPNALAFRIESSGPVPDQGTGAAYRLTGTLSFLDPPGEPGDEDDDEDDG